MSKKKQDYDDIEEEEEEEEVEYEEVEEEVEYEEVEEEEEEYEEEEEEELIIEENASIGGADDMFEKDVTKPKEKEYIILTPNDIVQQQKKEVAKVQEVLDISVPFARILLRHYRWDIEKLLSKFFTFGRQKLYEEAGVCAKGDVSTSSTLKTITCEGCFDDVGIEDTTALNCQHRFCNKCWTTYISKKIKAGQSKKIQCMSHKCNVLFDEVLIPSFVDSSCFKIYEKSLIESYIEDNIHTKWCPSTPHCGNAAYVSGLPNVDVNCSCGQEYCFGCLKAESHTPTSCKMIKEWDKKCSDDSETLNWLNANTKDCPKCAKIIEKNGGCNLMTCSGCGQFFCWLCGQATGQAHTWERIEGHSCGKFKEDSDKTTDVAQNALRRYLHYFERYQAHDKSRKLEQKLRDDIALKMQALYDDNKFTIYEIQWLENGLEKLFECRKILKWTYPFCYYLFGEDTRRQYSIDLEKKKSDIYKNLFEDQQEQLEKSTERLSKILESPLQEMSKNELLKKDIMNLTVLCDSRLKGMIDTVERDILGSGDYTVLISSYTPKPVDTKRVNGSISSKVIANSSKNKK